MLPLGSYDPENLEMLSKVLDDHCAKNGIERASVEHEEASSRVLRLFENGVRTADELRAALELTDRAGLGDYSLGRQEQVT